MVCLVVKDDGWAPAWLGFLAWTVFCFMLYKSNLNNIIRNWEGISPDVFSSTGTWQTEFWI